MAAFFVKLRGEKDPGSYKESSFTNKAQFSKGFSERLKLKDDAVLTILDPT